MPIKLSDDFPAKAKLEQEDIFAIENRRAKHQDIRPLKILIINLMPNKIETELQLLRLISQSPLQIDVDFLKMVSHESKNVSRSHLDKFYLSFPEIKDSCYDGVIITGAPLGQLTFEQVDYWPELSTIMDWTQTNTTSVVHICWGAQAGLYHHYGINKIHLPQKLFGVFQQKLLQPHRLLRGFDDIFLAPQSRYSQIDEQQLDDRIKVIAGNQELGATILISSDNKNIFLLGHFEYDTETLKDEYLRDLKEGLKTSLPKNYFIDNDINKPIINCWRGNAHLLYHNWLNDVYQQTPYQLMDILKQNNRS